MTAAVETRATRDGLTGPVLAWALGGLLAVAAVTTLCLPLLASGWAGGWFWWVHAPVAALAFGTPAVLLIKRERTSRVGWLLGLVALLMVTADACASWAWLAIVGRPGSLSSGPTALWLASTLWLPGFLLLPTVVLLLAPEGHLPGPRWRPVLWLSMAAIGLATIVHATAPYDSGPGADTVVPDQPATLVNPVESDVLQRWLGWSPLLVVLAAVGCVAGLVVRRRRALGRERRQLDVVACGAAATLALTLAGFAVPHPWFLVVVALALTPYPVALGVAAARHRLWDLDIVVRRSVVYGVVAGAAVAAYVMAIVVLGGALGRTTGAPLLATAVVAVGAAPLHARVQRAVDRRLFGDRADPAAALRRLAERWQAPTSSTATSEALNLMARDVTTSLRIPYARIVTATGEEGEAGEPTLPETRVPLRHDGGVVGELVAGAREPGRPLGRRDETTLSEIAGYVAVVVHSLQVSSQLRTARERTVVAREEERRRLRRDLHDGLGPELAAIALQLETVRDLADGPDTPAGALAESLREQVRGVVSQVRHLVDGLRPATLDDLGLAAALREQAARLSSARMTVDVDVDGLPMLSAAVDLAVLRIVGEAVTNAARHSGAAACHVAVNVVDGLLEVVVADNGRGMARSEPHQGFGLGSMRVRALELGGSCTVESAEGAGTTVRAFLPLENA